MTRFFRLLPICLALATVQPALAQDASLSPVSGSAALASGFTPDPYEVEIQSGGALDARAAGGPSCTGFVSASPSFRLFYSAGEGAPLVLAITGPQAGLLLVNTPDGRWTCASSGSGARLRLEAPQTGQYDIWAGNGEAGAPGAASLQVSEHAAP
ncbi:MAG: peptidase S1 [Pseudomonadota bacterium]